MSSRSTRVATRVPARAEQRYRAVLGDVLQRCEPGRVNSDVRVLVADAERAAECDDWQAARAAYVDAGDCATGYGLWRSAMRCYRHALELELTDAAVVERAVAISTHLAYATSLDWLHYRATLADARFPRFSCRKAEVVVGERGCYVTCPLVGPVLSVAMPARGVIDAAPFPRFARVPPAMALIVLRRALFAGPRDEPYAPRLARVTFANHASVELDELGDWWPAMLSP